MAKKRQKQEPWWKTFSSGYDPDKFSNTLRQHQEKLDAAEEEEDYEVPHYKENEHGQLVRVNGKQPELNGMGVPRKEHRQKPKTSYLLDDYDYESSYDYGYGGSFKSKGVGDFSKGWDKYEKTGEWKGYTAYKTATLSYKYVQQMANTIAAQGNVKIEVGNHWEVDIKNRKLTYSPTSLMYGTKGELLATLLHEVGKISNSMSRDKLTSTFLAIHQDPAYMALSIFEDMRVDMIMLKEYPSAGEVYESNSAVVQKVAEEHLKRGNIIRDLLIKQAEGMKQNTIQQIEMNRAKVAGRPDADELIKGYIKVTTKSNFLHEMESIDEIVAYIDQYKQEQLEEPMLDEYISDMLRESYGIDKMKPVEKCARYVEATAPRVLEAVNLKNTQEVISMMDSQVYPVIEKLLKQPKNGSETANKFFSNEISKIMMGNIMQKVQADEEANGEGGSQVDKNGNMAPRLPGRGRGEKALPKEWQDGEYNSLKESVEYEIKQLINRLNFIRREEDTAKFQGNQRRGKLDTKRLYRHATGNRRIFKKILPKRDTIQSFAFSLLVDISGSMSGDRIINAVRGLIVFAEVFNRFQIPFEIMAFDGHTKPIKGFSEEFDRKMKAKIGGIVKMANGGTVLGQALDKVKLHQQSEANKICIVLTDGDTESHDSLDNKYFIPWEKKGIKSIGVGIETGKRIETLCHNNGIAIDNSAKLPEAFARILKNLIKR